LREDRRADDAVEVPRSAWRHDVAVGYGLATMQMSGQLADLRAGMEAELANLRARIESEWAF
jgi:chaperonin GroEL (HSP60 family)